VVDRERDRQLDKGDAGLLGELRELLDDVQLALVRGAVHVEPGAGPGG
jgi:hypothetical protein